MAFLSGFVKSGLSLLGKDSISFPYSIGTKVEWFDDQTIWSLHHGTKKEDGSKVSVFTFDCTKNRDKIQLARNAFKRMRTMRHPDLLRYLDGAETESAIMFVTDPIKPLSDQLNQDPDPHLILWGLYKVANAIKFINHDCGMVHGNVRVSSIFTNEAGEWKLGGLELLSSMKEESPMILTFGGLAPEAQRYAAPEIKKSGWTVIKDLPTSAIDSYLLGCLVYEAYNHRFDTADRLLTNKGNIPTAIYESYRALLHPSPASRADADRFLDEGLRHGGYFTDSFVQINLFLENISIKEQSEKEVFFRKLDAQIDTFPSDFSQYKILPELLKAFEFGSGGAKALNAILKIGQHLDSDQFEKILVEPIVRMFASPDRAIRVSLLENMPKFIEHIPSKVVTNQIFPNVSTGFTDTVPVIREQTIKAILYLVPKLSDRIINYDLLKHLAKLQMDEEPGIRTNTTICLGKIAKNLSDATRKKVLVPAFTRGLRDGFHHARVAALLALTATAEFYDIPECAGRILPAISQALIDKEKPVRIQAFKAMHAFLKRIEEYAETMPDTALEPSSSSIGGTTPTSGVNNNESAMVQAGSLSMVGVFGEATKGIAGWAVSSLNARLASPSGEIVNPVQAMHTGQATTTATTTPTDSPTSISESFDQRRKDTSATTNRLGINDDDEGVSRWDNLIVSDNDQEEGWEPFDAPPLPTKHDPEPIEVLASFGGGGPARAVSSFGASMSPSATAHRAPGSMRLGPSKPSAPGYGFDNDDDANIKSASAGLSKEEKRAEMERRREERRQRMAELREKKKGGIGAKKI